MSWPAALRTNLKFALLAICLACTSGKAGGGAKPANLGGDQAHEKVGCVLYDINLAEHPPVARPHPGVRECRRTVRERSTTLYEPELSSGPPLRRDMWEVSILHPSGSQSGRGLVWEVLAFTDVDANPLGLGIIDPELAESLNTVLHGWQNGLCRVFADDFVASSMERPATCERSGQNLAVYARPYEGTISAERRYLDIKDVHTSTGRISGHGRLMLPTPPRDAAFVVYQVRGNTVPMEAHSGATVGGGR